MVHSWVFMARLYNAFNYISTTLHGMVTAIVYSLLRTHLIPVALSKINRYAMAHILHNLLNRPRLIFVARREVRGDITLVKGNALVHRLDILGVVLIRVDLRVMLPHPLRVLGLSSARVDLDLIPIGVLQ